MSSNVSLEPNYLQLLCYTSAPNGIILTRTYGPVVAATWQHAPHTVGRSSTKLVDYSSLRPVRACGHIRKYCRQQLCTYIFLSSAFIASQANAKTRGLDHFVCQRPNKNCDLSKKKVNAFAILHCKENLTGYRTCMFTVSFTLSIHFLKSVGCIQTSKRTSVTVMPVRLLYRNTSQRGSNNSVGQHTFQSK